MATRTWAGRAKPVAHVVTIQVTAYHASTTYTVTINGKSITTIAAGSVNATATALATAWNAATGAEIEAITASAATDTLTLTHDTAGVPFVVTKSVSGGTGTLGSVTVATAAVSPNHWGTAVNWAEGSVPVTGDDVVINAGPSILHDLDQNAVTLATLTIGPGFPETAEIGLASNSSPSAPASGYPQYLDQRLKIGATVTSIETRSRRIRLDLTPAPTTVSIRSTGQPATSNEPALDLAADNAGGSTVVHAMRGNFWLNGIPGDTGTVSDVNISYRDTPSSDVTMMGGTGLTVTRLDQSGGDVTLQNGATTILKSDGRLTITAGAVTTLTNRGGLVNHDGTGTITTLANKGTFVRRGFRAGTITNATLYAGSQTSDPNGVLIWTNPPSFYECRLAAGPDDRGADVAYANFGAHRLADIRDIGTVTPVELQQATQVAGGTGTGGAIDCNERPVHCRAILTANDDTGSSSGTFTARIEESSTGSGSWSTVATFDACDWNESSISFQVLPFTRTKRYLRWAYSTTGTPTTVNIAIILE